jgi:hypothetical protein
MTRCSTLSRRTRTTVRFPSTGRASITANRGDALRPRSHSSIAFPHTGCRLEINS